MAQSDLVQSLLRGLDLLRLVSSGSRGMSLNELSRASGLQKTTAYNLLRTLCARDFLVKDEQNRFQIGSAVFDIAESSHFRRIRNRTEKALLELHKKFPMDVLTVSVLHNGEAKCVLRCSPDRTDELQHPINMSFSPYISVTSMALRAADPENGSQIEWLFPFEEYGRGMWSSMKEFNAERAKTLKQGFCCRQQMTRFAAAFIMPEGYVLGFNSDGEVEAEIAKRQQGACEFRQKVWGDYEK